MTVTRRSFLRGVGAGVITAPAMGFAHLASGYSSLMPVNEQGEFLLPELDYPYDALEPTIDAATMKLHHDIHHAGYVNGLNNAIAQLSEARTSGDTSMIKHWSRELAFHGSGHFLHSIFWKNMTPKGGGEPKGALATAINIDFGGFDFFKIQFAAAASAVEGSGWGILGYHITAKELMIIQAEKHQNLSVHGIIPLLVIDVWEHAYYLKYQNKRGDYVKNFFNVINWDDVAKRLEALIS